MAKMIGSLAIDLTMSLLTTLAADRPRKTSAPYERLGQRARVGLDRMRRLPLVEVGAAFVDHALAVAHDDIVAVHAHRLDKLGAGDGGGAGAVHHHLDFGRACGSVR